MMAMVFLMSNPVLQFFLDDVDLEEELAVLDQVPDPGQLGLGQLVADLGQLEEEEFQDLLAEGYKANIPDGLALTRDFEPADLEGWDEY